ncbi:MAG: hypothetical protein ABDH32_07365 [Candidatus Caldarchaeales archaeon]
MPRKFKIESLGEREEDVVKIEVYADSMEEAVEKAKKIFSSLQQTSIANMSKKSQLASKIKEVLYEKFKNNESFTLHEIMERVQGFSVSPKDNEKEYKRFYDRFWTVLQELKREGIVFQSGTIIQREDGANKPYRVWKPVKVEG